MSRLIKTVHNVLDRRLLTDCSQPLALALSGGGDSVALALIVTNWARARGRRLVCLTVDHGLNPASPAWTETCRAFANELGADFQSLTWVGPKPASGLPAAARAERHALLAKAARAAGSSVILMGHTASDLAESAAMRQAGSTTPDAREWAPSPIWPAGRGIFLLRPMLGLERSDLRDWLRDQGARWIDDPANDDMRFSRSRARRNLTHSPPGSSLSATVIPPDLAQLVEEDFGLVMSRRALAQADHLSAIALVGVACVCAGGGGRLPRGDRLEHLTQALRGEAAVSSTLVGCQIMADRDKIRWVRPVGEISRSGSADLSLGPRETGVWDGRYEVTAGSEIRVGPLAGHRSDLAPAQRTWLARVPAKARGSLPWHSPQSADVQIRSLVLARFQAAAGLVHREPLT